MYINRELRSSSSSLPLLIAVSIALALSVHSSAQQTASPGIGAGAAQVKITPVSTQGHVKIPATSGRLNYTAYCASCHGAAGKGDGPAAAGLKQRPTDLTQMSAKNNGKFPWTTVSNVLEAAGDRPEHGSSVMPNWWLAFRAQDPGNPTKFSASVRVHNLASYLEAMQVSAH